MPITKLQFKPGIHREGTAYSEEGNWYNCDKVRFRSGFPEKIGGWIRATANTFKGVARILMNWTLLDSTDCLAVGTSKKFYIEQSGVFYDITPVRFTDTNTDPITTGSAGTNIHTYTTSSPHTALAGDFVIFSSAVDVDGVCADSYTDPFKTEAVGSDIIHVTTPTPHYALAGDIVTFSGTTGYAGIPDGDFNTSLTIIEVTSDTEYIVRVATPATDPYIVGGGSVTATYLSRLNREFEIIEILTPTSFTFRTDSICTAGGVTGGGTITAKFLVNVGSTINITGGGWGAGVWSRNTWSSPVTGQVSNISMRLWSVDNFGEDLIYCTRDGNIYYWDATSGLSTRGVRLDTLPGASDVPDQASIVLVTDERHVVAVGATDRNTAAFDPLLIRWSSQEDAVDWTPTLNNTAGSQRIPMGSYVMAALASRQETLIWTDHSLHSLQYTGAPYVFGLQTLAENIDIIGPNAAANVNNVTYWMGKTRFWVYSGRVQSLNCTVQRYVFEDLNVDQAPQIYATTNDNFTEVTWFYCSKDSVTLDKYVTYNYGDDLWTFGTIDRTAMVQCKGRGGFPYAAAGGYTSDEGILYVHDVGYDDGSTNPPSPIEAYIESADLDIQDGDKLIFADRIIPDVTFSRSTSDAPSVTLTLETKKFPGQDIISSDSRIVTKTITATVDQFTKQVWARLRGRQLRLKVSSDTLGTCWLLGSVRINMRPDGRQ